MPEIEELEREWRRYKVKKLKPVFAAVLVVSAGAAAWWLWPTGTSVSPAPSQHSRTTDASGPSATSVKTKSPSVPQETMERPPSSEVPPNAEPVEIGKTADVTPKRATTVTKAAPAPLPDSSAPKNVRKKEVVLQPDTAFLESFASEMGRSETAPVREEVIRPVPAKKPPVTRVPQKAKPVEEKPVTDVRRTARSRVEEPAQPHVATREAAPEPDRQNNLVISTKQTNNTLQYLIKRFNQTRDPKLAAYIAQSFYKKGNYKETVRWAILANSIDPSSEESWLLFAKAKVQLGQKQDAIKALKIYLNQYTSGKVKAYLQSLETGL